MNLSLILMQKTTSLFLIMLMGGIIVRLKLLKSTDSRSLSAVVLYLINPCTILSAFQVEYSPAVRNGVLLGIGAAIAIHIFMIVAVSLLRKPLHLTPLEEVSVIYTNCGNLVIPLVTAILGEEYVIYTIGYILVQLVLVWSHGKSVLCGEPHIELKQVLRNINMIASLIGAVMFFSGIRLPSILKDTVSTVGSLIGPVSMIVAGMLIGGMNLRQLLNYRRLPMVCLLRLVVLPLMILALLRFGPLTTLIPDGQMVLLISLLAAITPAASTVTQMTQLYAPDCADYSSAINVATTLLCIVTMPCIILLYQL